MMCEYGEKSKMNVPSILISRERTVVAFQPRGHKASRLVMNLSTPQFCHPSQESRIVASF